MIRLALALVVALSAGPAAAETIPGPISATVIRVYDGDTFLVSAKIWLRQEVTVWVRIRGMDAPELGRRARCPAEKRLGETARDRLLALIGDGPVELRNVGQDKYGGRVDADVNVAGIDVAASLITEGLARHYGGGRRQGWCG